MVQTGVFHSLNQSVHLNLHHALAVSGHVLFQSGQVRILGVVTGQHGFFLFHAPFRHVVSHFAAAKRAALPAEIGHVVHVHLGNCQCAGLFFAVQNHAVFRHHAQTGEHVIRGGFAGAGRCHNHTSQQMLGTVLHIQLRLLGGGHGCRERCHLGNQRCAVNGLIDAHGHQLVHVVAHFHSNGQVAVHIAGEHHIVGQPGFVPAADNNVHGLIVRAAERRSVHFRAGHHGDDVAVVHCRCAAVQLAAQCVGQAHEHQHIQLFRSLYHLAQCVLAGIQQIAHANQVIAGHAGQRQLREHQNLYALFLGRLNGFNHTVGIVIRVSDANYRRCRSNFYKSVFHFNT